MRPVRCACPPSDLSGRQRRAAGCLDGALAVPGRPLGDGESRRAAKERRPPAPPRSAYLVAFPRPYLQVRGALLERAVLVRVA